MTKKKSEQKVRFEEKAAWVGFVNYSPTEEERGVIKSSWIPTPSQMIDRILRWVDEGYKVSFGWDSYSNCYQVSLIGYYSDSPNPGMALSSRHSDPNTAVGVLSFIVEEVFSNGPWEQEKQKELEFNW